MTDELQRDLRSVTEAKLAVRQRRYILEHEQLTQPAPLKPATIREMLAEHGVKPDPFGGSIPDRFMPQQTTQQYAIGSPHHPGGSFDPFGGGRR
jgi:hypothetical protein